MSGQAHHRTRALIVNFEFAPVAPDQIVHPSAAITISESADLITVFRR